MKKHRVRNTLLIIALVLVVAIVAVGIWQRNNIKAALLVATTDQTQLAEKQEQLTQKREDLLEELLGDYKGNIDFGEPTAKPEPADPNEAQTPESTEPSDPEVTESETPESESPAQDAPESAQQPEPVDEFAESNAMIAQCVNTLQTLEDSYMGQINQVVEDAKTEFYSQPQSEWNNANKSRILSAKIAILASLESECDAKVEEQLAIIQRELDKQGRKGDQVAQIREIYLETKATWKAMCLTEMRRSK